MFETIKLHDTRSTLAARLATRKHAGPYEWTPSAPGRGRGFYQSPNALAMDRHGSTLRLRLEEAPLRCRPRSYSCDDRFTEYQPIIARLPRSRGFLAGWTMGNGMIASLDSEIHETERDATHAAHDAAERAAIENAESAQEEGDEWN